MSGLWSGESLNLPILVEAHQHLCGQTVGDEMGNVETERTPGWCPVWTRFVQPRKRPNEGPYVPWSVVTMEKVVLQWGRHWTFIESDCYTMSWATRNQDVDWRLFLVKRQMELKGKKLDKVFPCSFQPSWQKQRWQISFIFMPVHKDWLIDWYRLIGTGCLESCVDKDSQISGLNIWIKCCYWLAMSTKSIELEVAKCMTHICILGWVSVFCCQQSISWPLWRQNILL